MGQGKMILFDCSGCGKKLRVADTLANKHVQCPVCASLVAVPPLAGGGPAVPRPAQAAFNSDTSMSAIHPGALPPLVSALPRPSKLDPGLSTPADNSATQESQAAPESDQTLHENKKKQAAANDGGQRWDFLALPQTKDELGRLGPYRVLRVLGAGGMGVVFWAEDPYLGRPVALKVMLPHVVASMPGARQRFLREARATAAIEHDHIVTIYAVDEDRGVPYIAMQMLRGESLEKRLRREGKLPLKEVLRIGREVATALAAAHSQSLIHRDIKPSNVWLEQGAGRVKLLDFGLALGGDDIMLTQPGVIVGTPAYMAPEQAAAAHNVDHRCDLFSLGCILYRTSTGMPAFAGSGTMSVLLALELHNPEPPGRLNPSLPADFSALVMQLLAKKPDRRPGSAKEVVKRLQAVEEELARPVESFKGMESPPLLASMPGASLSPPVHAIPVAQLEKTSIAAAGTSALSPPNLGKFPLSATPIVPIADIPDLPPLPPDPSPSPGAKARFGNDTGTAASLRRRRLILGGALILLAGLAVSVGVFLPGILFTGNAGDLNKTEIASNTGADNKTETSKKTDPGKKSSSGPDKIIPVPLNNPVPEFALDPVHRLLYEYDAFKSYGLCVLPGGPYLTGSPYGQLSSTVIRVDDDPPTKFGSSGGYWRGLKQESPKRPEPGAPLNFNRTKNVFETKDSQIRVIQVVEVITSKQPVVIEAGKAQWLQDTLLVAWQIENADSKPHVVGLRTLVETKIGMSNLGAFAVPGLPEPVTALADFKTDPKKGQSVPPFIQMQEFHELHKPGTIAQLSLKVGGGLETASRLSLTHWEEEQRPWEIPVKSLDKKGSVVLYWEAKMLQPGEKRWLGYTYGMGYLHANPEQKPPPYVALTLDGDFEAGKEFVVMAYVQEPQKSKSLKLALPPGLVPVKCKEEQPVPEPIPPGISSLITWTVRAKESAHYELKLETDGKTVLRHDVYVAKAGEGKNLDKQKIFD